MKKRVLLLGAGKFYRPCISSVRSLGYEVICIDRDPHALAQDVCDAFYPVDFCQNEEVLALCRTLKVGGIVPLNDYGVETAAFVSQQLGLPGISMEAAQTATDKYRMREAWKRANVPNPAYCLVHSLQEAQDAMDRIGTPVILKPANSKGGGSRGVQMVNEPSELPEAFGFAGAAYQDNMILLEKCVTGIEHSAEVIIIDGKPHVITISDKVKSPYPYRVDEKVVYPTQVRGKALNALVDAIERAVMAAGLSTTGSAHVEACSTSDGPILFELGARCGGGATPHPITSYVSGYAYFENVIRLLSGDMALAPSPFVPEEQNPCIYGFFSVENQEDKLLQHDNRFLDWQLFTEKQERPLQTRQGSDRLGYYIFKGRPEELPRKKAFLSS